MFSTDTIGLWSIIEEGIGIIAGSMPALRPLLSLPVFGRSTLHSDSYQPSAGISNSRLTPSPMRRLDSKPSDGVKMTTSRAATSATKGPGLYRSRPRPSSDDDGDSQKNILKETQRAVIAENSLAADDWSRQQVLGWNNRIF